MEKTVAGAATAAPPMGWNSWDCFGTSVTEEEVMQNARYMAEHLLEFGWNTIVVDIQWYEPTARSGGYNEDAPILLDAWGRPRPAENRFPSAAGVAGFGPLAGAIHELGLRFGLHIMRGIPRRAVELRLPVLGTQSTAAEIADPTSRCDWNSDNYGLDLGHPDAQAYYDSLLALFADWEVDYLKVDDMVGPFHGGEIAAFAAAAEKVDREIVISLSPGRDLSTVHAPELRRNSELWRISADLWDNWSDILGQFDRLAMWAPFVGDGKWADADMLPLGRIGIRAENGPDRLSRLSADEARTTLTLWCIARSPLMFGGHLPSTDPATLDLLTNRRVLDILKTSTHNRQVLRVDGLAVWVADDQDSTSRYVAIFGTSDEPFELELPLASLGLASDAVLTDLWSGARRSPGSRIVDVLPPHGCLLLVAEK